MRLCLALLIVLFAATHASTSYARPQQIIAYAYHLKPPFITDLGSENGLYYDLSKQLSDEKFEVYTVFVPRKRIDKLLLNPDFNGIIIGVHPKWFDDKDKKRYLWSKPFYRDLDEFISLKSSAFDYQRPSSLHGKSLAGVSGFYYVHIEPLVKARKIQRFDTIGEQEVIKMVMRGRADIGIVSRSTLDYMKLHNQFDNIENLHVSSKPHDAFNRHILIPPNSPQLLQHINAKIESMPSDPDWQRTQSRYR